MKLSFVVPGHPIGKQRPRHTKKGGGRTYTPKKTLDYEKAIRDAANAASFQRGDYMLGMVEHGVYWPLEATYSVTFRAYCKSGVHADVDNIAKIVLDGLQGAAYKNDKSVTRLTCLVDIDRENPRLEVEVEVIDE